MIFPIFLHPYVNLFHVLSEVYASFETLAVPCGESWNVLITGPPSWGFDVLLATALCKNLPAEKAQRQLSQPKPNKGL